MVTIFKFKFSLIKTDAKNYPVNQTNFDKNLSFTYDKCNIIIYSNLKIFFPVVFALNYYVCLFTLKTKILYTEENLMTN